MGIEACPIRQLKTEKSSTLNMGRGRAHEHLFNRPGPNGGTFIPRTQNCYINVVIWVCMWSCCIQVGPTGKWKWHSQKARKAEDEGEALCAPSLAWHWYIHNTWYFLHGILRNEWCFLAYFLAWFTQSEVLQQGVSGVANDSTDAGTISFLNTKHPHLEMVEEVSLQ